MIPTKEQMDSLVERKLATVKKHNGLNLYKYHRKVFYNNLWHLDPALMECRGVVFADDGELVQLPFRKVFNVGENGTQIDDNTVYKISRKVNGFMAAMTQHQGKMLVTTTGSFTSNFVNMAEKHIKMTFPRGIEEGTVLFEICDDQDPHIVHEKTGSYLLATRLKSDGEIVFPNRNYDHSLFEQEADGCTIKEMVKNCKHEGYCIYTLNNEPVAKMKSPHYLSKKAIMRLGDGKVDIMYDNKQEFRKRLDEEFYNLLDFITESFKKSEWKLMKDQERRKVIEDYFGDNV